MQPLVVVSAAARSARAAAERCVLSDKLIAVGNQDALGVGVYALSLQVVEHSGNSLSGLNLGDAGRGSSYCIKGKSFLVGVVGRIVSELNIVGSVLSD